jgi:hypothetical protein
MPSKLKAQFAVDVVTLCFQLSEEAVGIRSGHLELQAQFVRAVRADKPVPRPGGRDGLQNHSRECVNVVAMLASGRSG